MTNDDCDRIEARLSIKLSDDYRNVVTNYPADLPVHVRKHEIWNDADAIISRTEELRVGYSPELRIPDGFVVIGDSGCGDYYCLDLTEFPSPIKCWNHEIADWEITAQTIRHFVQQCRNN